MVESPEARFQQFLERRGERPTGSRLALVRQVLERPGLRGVDELVRDVHAEGRVVSRATVHRTVRLLVEAGLLGALRLHGRIVHRPRHASGPSDGFE